MILAIAFVSCQSAPRSPVVRAPAHETSVAETPPPEDVRPPSPEEETNAAGSPASPESASARPGEKPAAVSVSIGSSTPPKKVPPVKPIISPARTGLLGPAKQKAAVGAQVEPGEKQHIVLNFEKADIAEATNQIFSDQLKLSYVMDQTLQGRISLYIDGDYNNEELLRMVTTAYETNGITVIPREGFYFIGASQKAGAGGLPLAGEALTEPDSPSRPMIVVYRLRFVDSKQASNVITPFLTPGRKVLSEPFTNTLIFVENTENARSIVSLLKTIDIDVLKEISLQIVPLQNISPQDAIQGMDSLMNKLGGFKESSIKNSVAFMPLNNFGGVLVMAQNPELLKSAAQWIEALDARSAGNAEDIHVYFVQNGLARDIADILGQVFGITTGTGGMGQQVVPSGRTGASSSGIGGSSFGATASGGTTGGLFGKSATSGGSASTTGTTGSSATGGSSSAGSSGTAYSRAASGGASSTGGVKPGGVFTGDVMVIADEVNNAIVVRANGIDYDKIKKTIETLDILPRAVLIEVVVAEVQLNKDFAFGVEYYYQTHPKTNTGVGLSLGGLSNVASTSTTSSSSVTTTTYSSSAFPINIGEIAGSGLGVAWVSSSQNFAVLLNMLSTKTHVTVLSTPTLLATDNKEATITVGGSVPVSTGSYATTETSTSANSVFSTIQYAETGVILNVTPHINAGGLVRIELEQTIRRVDSTTTVGADNTEPTFTERNLKTTVLAQNGQTIVIGGIIDSQTESTKSGVPYLENIPLLSPLFSSKSSDTARTEVLVALTPHVIDQRGSEAPRELMQKLNNLKLRAVQ